MSNSLQQHGFREINKQLRFRMIASGLDTIKISGHAPVGKIQIQLHRLARTGREGGSDSCGLGLMVVTSLLRRNKPVTSGLKKLIQGK
jgi:hypothetical protein